MHAAEGLLPDHRVPVRFKEVKSRLLHVKAVPLGVLLKKVVGGLPCTSACNRDEYHAEGVVFLEGAQSFRSLWKGVLPSIRVNAML